MVLVVAAVAALIVANSPLSAWYASLRDTRIGPASVGLQLTVGQWTADGLLAVFFFLAGLELKHEFVVGNLRDPRQAVVPVLAAVGGMAAPALVYLAVTAGDPAARAGWAIPTATDIAFALAVLAVVGRHLPGELRTFLLALAVVDDLLAIVVIAVFFSHDLTVGYLAASLVAVAAFAVVVRRCRRRLVARRILLTVLALVAWALMLRSGVHATVAGVLLGFTVPMRAPRRRRAGGTHAAVAGGAASRRRVAPSDTPRPASPGLLPLATMAARIDDAVRPFSAGVAVPLFAFFAAGVTVGGLHGLGAALTSPVALGAALGLVIGKTVGIAATALGVGRLVRSPLLHVLALADWVGVAIVGGVGFTVSLLIGHLAFPASPAHVADAQVGVVAGSIVASLLAAAVLGARSRHYRTVRARTVAGGGAGSAEQRGDRLPEKA